MKVHTFVGSSLQGLPVHLTKVEPAPALAVKVTGAFKDIELFTITGAVDKSITACHRTCCPVLQGGDYLEFVWSLEDGLDRFLLVHGYLTDGLVASQPNDAGFHPRKVERGEGVAERIVEIPVLYNVWQASGQSIRPSRLVMVPSPCFFLVDPIFRRSGPEGTLHTERGVAVVSVTVAVVFVTVAVEVMGATFVSMTVAAVSVTEAVDMPSKGQDPMEPVLSSFSNQKSRSTSTKGIRPSCHDDSTILNLTDERALS